MEHGRSCTDAHAFSQLQLQADVSDDTERSSAVGCEDADASSMPVSLAEQVYG